MSKHGLTLLLCAVVALSGCKRRDSTPPPPKNQVRSTQTQQLEKSEFDACALITKQEVEMIEGSPVNNTKNSGHYDAGLRFTQCFYTTAEFSRSVSLAITQPDPRATPKRDIKELWEQTFGKNDHGEKEEAEKKTAEKEADKEKRESLQAQRREREEEQSVPPKKIEGVGEEAFWSATRVGGALYVLKKDAYVRVSVGGSDPEDKKIEKCKALAQKALDRL